MVKFSKLGAAALALALTVTFVAPTSVRAWYYDKNGSGTETYDAETNTVTKNEDDEKAVYTNKVTKATYTGDDYTSKEYEAATKYDYGFKTKYDLGVDDYMYYPVSLEYGEKFTSLKVKSGKASIAIKLSGKSEETDYPIYDDEKKQYYFMDRKNDNKIYVGTAGIEEKDENQIALKSTRYGYSYRIFGKKAGTAKVELKYKDTTGKAVTKKITIRVTNDARVFTSVTYAGKQLLDDYSKKANYATTIKGQTENKEGIKYTSKKSGKFKVKMNKNFKWVATYVLKPTDYVTVTSKNEYSSGDFSWSRTSSYLERKVTKGVDLNGDGDTFDIINGISEDDYEGYVATSVKNGKSIKLSTVPDKSDFKYNRDQKDGSTTWNASETSTHTGNMATTIVLVAYQDKVTKSFDYEPFTITVRVKK